MQIWVTSDTHFGHANIIRYCNRPFASAEEMDEAIVERWNAVVRPHDHVYHLGDVAIRRRDIATSGRLNGHKRLVRGNHDVYRTKDYLKHFEEIHGCRVIDRVLLTHIPIHPLSMGRFLGNVHGHVHNSNDLPLPYLNVCVEMTNYTPIPFEEAKRKVSQ